VSLQILDADTAVVTHKLTSVALAAGQHVYYWQRKDDHGVAVPAGSYVARLIVQTGSGPVVADVPFTVG
jgi:flagellar hook assembly protein FlgD